VEGAGTRGIGGIAMIGILGIKGEGIRVGVGGAEGMMGAGGEEGMVTMVGVGGIEGGEAGVAIITMVVEEVGMKGESINCRFFLEGEFGVRVFVFSTSVEFLCNSLKSPIYIFYAKQIRWSLKRCIIMTRRGGLR
jgi:hypothetical protein